MNNLMFLARVSVAVVLSAAIVGHASPPPSLFQSNWITNPTSLSPWRTDTGSMHIDAIAGSIGSSSWEIKRLTTFRLTMPACTPNPGGEYKRRRDATCSIAFDKGEQDLLIIRMTSGNVRISDSGGTETLLLTVNTWPPSISPKFVSAAGFYKGCNYWFCTYHHVESARFVEKPEGQIEVVVNYKSPNTYPAVFTLIPQLRIGDK